MVARVSRIAVDGVRSAPACGADGKPNGSYGYFPNDSYGYFPNDSYGYFPMDVIFHVSRGAGAADGTCVVPFGAFCVARPSSLAQNLSHVAIEL
jgi:hypothetical protein